MNKEICCLILNYIDYQETISCITNLLEKDRNKKLIIVIVDNNSPNDSFSILKSEYKDNYNVHVIQSESNGGYAKGNNFGFAYIGKILPSVEYTIVMNPDTRLCNIDDVWKLREAFKIDDKIAIVAPVVILNGKINYKGTAWNAPDCRQILKHHCKFIKYETFQYIDEQSSGLVYVDAVQGGFFMVKMKVLFDIGLMDEHTFMYCEEVLLAKDLQRKGYKEAVLSNVFFEHNHKNKETKITLRGRIEHENNFWKSRKIYCKKNFGRVSVFQLTLVHFLNCIYIILTHAIVLKKIRI